MKKKLFLLLLIVALTAFVFTGCTPPAEGEGEGEGEIEGVVVDIDGAVELDGRTYVAGGNHTITVTFPAPVANVNVYISDCTGDYSKQPSYYYYGTPVALWPNADKTVWTGSGYFDCDPCYTDCITTSHCCASVVQVVAGECEGNVCVAVPVVVDCGKPYAEIKVKVDDCCCETCALVFESVKSGSSDPCDSCSSKDCCGDNCSGLASWQIDLYKVKNASVPADFFDPCCGITPCAELIDTCTGTECPIKCETKCLEPGIMEAGATSWNANYYYAVITLEDNVGNTQTYYAQIELGYAKGKTGTIVDKTYDTGCHVFYQEICCGEDVLCPTTSATPIGACSDTDTCVKPI